MDFEINPKVIIIYFFLLLLTISISLTDGIPRGLTVGSALGLIISFLLTVEVE